MVAARETTLQELLEGSKQYQVPLYQRPYAWRDPQLQRLWEDILRIAEARSGVKNLTHFIGSLVLAPSPSNGPAGVQEFLVVDGQQRLTTLSILLCALRDHRAESEDLQHRDRINEQYLLNKWKPVGQRLKLVPTQADRVAYEAVIDSTPQKGGTDRVGAAYRFFTARLATLASDDEAMTAEQIEEAVIGGLALVCVTAQAGDNAHRIFESLNNTGLRLTQGDLLRNYIFMRLPTRGEEVYHSIWLPMQESLTGKGSSDALELLFWLDLVQRDSRAQQANTYADQQARMDLLAGEEAIVAELERFARLAGLLVRILEPGEESHPEVRQRLQRLRTWGTTTVYPLLLHLLERRDARTATDEQVARAMHYLESFFVRRLLIGRATANLNRILLDAVTGLDRKLPVDDAILRYLSTGRKYFASDAEIRNAVTAVPFYLNGRHAQRKLVLQWLEETYGSREPVDFTTLTIEHVMPQTLTQEWRHAVAESLLDGEEFEQIYESLLHTLGNLTLTGYNAALSNSPFGIKRDHLRTSGLLMNQEIAAAERWGRAEILSRARALAERVIETWPGPTATEGIAASGVDWATMERAIAEIPAGHWTTYGDLAALIGSHPVPVGQRVASVPVRNAHRVMQADGRVSRGFRWSDPARTDDPLGVLRAEGVTFTDGRADPTQRLPTERLAQLVGLDVDALPQEVEDLDTGGNPELRDRFVRQLGDSKPATVAHATMDLIGSWSALGGELAYGRSAQTTCKLVTRNGAGERTWPMVIYPVDGQLEISFKPMSTRRPFDDTSVRHEMRHRLNEIYGVEIEADRIDLFPTVDLDMVVDVTARNQLVETLAWFLKQVRE